MTEKMEHIEFSLARLSHSPNVDESSTAEAHDGSVVGVVQEENDEQIVVRPANAIEGQYLTFTIAKADVTLREPYEPQSGELPDA